MTNAVLTATGSGALAGAGGSNQGALAALGDGELSGNVSTPVGLTTATIAGSGAATWVGASAAHGVITATGSGALAGHDTSVPPSILAATGVGAASWRGAGKAASVLTASGVGTANFVPITVKAAAAMRGKATTRFFGAYSNNLPFNYPPSWSIMFYGSTIEGCGYDPISRNLKVWFTGTQGQFVIIGPYGISITNQIELSPDPEAYVLFLIASAPPRPLPPPPPPTQPSWVLALQAPSGALPRVVLDFQNGRYWGNNAVQTLSAIVDGNGFGGGTFDMSTLIPGSGVLITADLTENSPNLISSFFGPTWLTSGFTTLSHFVGASPGFNNAGYASCIQADVECYDPTFTADTATQLAPRTAAIFDWSFTEQNTVSASRPATNRLRVASNMACPTSAVAIEGSTSVASTIGSPPVSPTQITLNGALGGTGDQYYYALIAFYDLQPQPNLTAISLL